MADKPRMFSAEHLEYLKRGIPVWPGDEERIRALIDAGKGAATPTPAVPQTAPRVVPTAQPTGQEMYPPTSPVDQRMAMYEKVRKEFEAKRAAAQTTPVDIPKFTSDVASGLGNFGGLLGAPSVSDLYQAGLRLLPPKTTATAATVNYPDAQVQPQSAPLLAPQPVQGVDPSVLPICCSGSAASGPS